MGVTRCRDPEVEFRDLIEPDGRLTQRMLLVEPDGNVVAHYFMRRLARQPLAHLRLRAEGLGVVDKLTRKP